MMMNGIKKVAVEGNKKHQIQTRLGKAREYTTPTSPLPKAFEPKLFWRIAPTRLK